MIPPGESVVAVIAREASSRIAPTLVAVDGVDGVSGCTSRRLGRGNARHGWSTTAT